MGMDDINSVRLAWVHRRMTILDKGSNGGNDGTIEVFRELGKGVSNFTHEDLRRSVSSKAIDLKDYRELDGYGVTEPDCVLIGAMHVVRLVDLIDMWMLGL